MNQENKYEKQKEKVKQITEQLHEGIKNLFESERYKEYLRTISNFYNYSANNCLLIAMQRPDASAVASYTTWRKKFERQVKKGSKGIAIIEPCPYTKKIQEIIRDENGNALKDKDGNDLTQNIEKNMIGFRVGYVYALEDTESAENKEFPSIVSILDKDVQDFNELMDTLHKISPVPIRFAEITGGANGYYDLVAREICIDNRLPQMQQIKTCIHEISHSILHDKVSGEDPQATRHEREVCAESVAFVVCNYLGLDTSEYSFGYISSYSEGKELKELQQKMELIRKTSNMIITNIETERQKNLVEQAAIADMQKGISRTDDAALLGEKTQKHIPHRRK